MVVVQRLAVVAALVTLLVGCRVNGSARGSALCAEWDRAIDADSHEAGVDTRPMYANVRALLPPRYWDDATLAWHLDGWEALQDDRAANDPDSAWHRSSRRVGSLHRRACREFDRRALLAIPLLAGAAYAGVKMRPRGVTPSL